MASSGVRRRSSAKKSAGGPKLPDGEDVGITSSSFTSSRPSSISKLDQMMDQIGHVDQIGSNPQPSPSAQLAELMGPPPVPAQTGSTRQSRASTASSTTSAIRSSNPNRLSLTLPLPIAMPSPDPTRPTPSSGTSSTHPPNSASGGALTASSHSTSNASWDPSDADPSTFIIAVAAQERRVLELREELGHAEAELVTLKSQWAKYEGTRKRGTTTTSASATRNGGIHSTPSTPQQGSGSGALPDDTIAARRSIELDRRRTMLLGQQIAAAPGSPRRRVIRGGHARTLSLLSPVKTDGTFSVDGDEPMSATLQLQRCSTDMGSAYRSAALQKRASWQPPRARTANLAVPPSSIGMAAIVEDLKQGFRTLATFVDDIRQVTVGDEPITGQSRRRGDEEWAIGGVQSRSTNDDRQSIRSSASTRPAALVNATGPPRSNTQTPTKASKKSLLDGVEPASDRGSAAAARKKHFSWAPLEFSNLDEEWAAWDSPLSTKSTRWSESNDTSSDESSTHNGVTDTPLKNKANTTTNASTLDDLLPQVVNKLSPGNLKRATSDFMGQWEKSLTTPSSPVTPVASADDKENLISF